MPQTYPLPLPSLKVLISGVDRTAEVLTRTLQIHAILGPQVDTCSLSLKSPESYRGTATSKPVVGQTIIVQVQTSPTAAWSNVFSGQISQVEEIKVANRTVRWDLQCVDNTHLLTRLLVIQNYQNMLVSDVVLAILTRYAGGIDSSGVQTSTGHTVASITFSYKTPLDCLEELANMIGWQWFLDPDNVLWFYDPNGSVRVASQSITDTSDNFDELRIGSQLDQVRNRIYVTGGIGLSTTVTETFDCDGIRDVFTLARRNIVSDQIGMTASGQVGTFMTLSGQAYEPYAVPQLTVVQGIGDASYIPSGWFVDVQNGIVLPGNNTATPPDGTLATFRYQFKTPVNVVRQDTTSMIAVAQLEGSDWVTVVSGDAPIHWWRLNDLGNKTARNRGTAGVQFSGSYTGGITEGIQGPIVNDASSYGVRFDGATGAMYTVSGVALPEHYTVECWARTTGAFSSAFPDYLWEANEADAVLGDAMVQLLIRGNTQAYGLKHREVGLSLINSGTLQSTAKPTFGRYDHIVAQFVNHSGSIWVNNERVAGPTWMPTPLRTSNTCWLQVAPINTARPDIDVAELTIYSGGLTAAQIGEHYYAGRYGGVREFAVTVNGDTSYDACVQRADAELTKYAAVLTPVEWTSFVPTWQVGDTVTVNVTTANLGRTFSGTALIQEITMRWLGAQRFQYDVKCTSTRYNPMDHARTIAAPRDPIVPNSPIGGLNLLTTFAEADTTLTLAGVLFAANWNLGINPQLPKYIAVGSGQTVFTNTMTQVPGETWRSQISSITRAGSQVLFTATLDTPDDPLQSVCSYGLIGGNATSAKNTGTLITLAAEPIPFTKDARQTLTITFPMTLASGVGPV